MFKSKETDFQCLAILDKPRFSYSSSFANDFLRQELAKRFLQSFLRLPKSEKVNRFVHIIDYF